MELHSAAARGDLKGIADALKLGANINAKNGHQQTALVCALEQKKGFLRKVGPTVTLDALEQLLNAGANLEIDDSLGATAIHHAAGIANPQFLELLINRGGNVKHFTTSGYSVLLHACFQPSSTGKRDIIRRLSEKGISLNAGSVHGEFPLGVCLRFGDWETLCYLLELGADPRPLGWTDLHHAVALKGKDVFDHSLNPAEINQPNERFHLSPWLLSCIRGDLNIVEALADKGADIFETGHYGETALHLAAEFGHAALVKWLLDRGMDPDVTQNFGETALHRAVEWNHPACVQALLEKGADVRSANQSQVEPVNSAHSIEVLQLLKEFGADINYVDGCGEWALKSAAEANDVDRISWLLDQGAEVDRTSTGETALHGAVRFDSREAIHVLLDAGANPNAQDCDGQTPLFNVQSREVIRILRQAGADAGISDQAGWGPEKWQGDPILRFALRH